MAAHPAEAAVAMTRSEIVEIIARCVRREGLHSPTEGATVRAAIRAMSWDELLATFAAVATATAPHRGHGLVYTSRDGTMTWPLTDDVEPDGPPQGAELVVLEALCRFAHARVNAWAT